MASGLGFRVSGLGFRVLYLKAAHPGTLRLVSSPSERSGQGMVSFRRVTGPIGVCHSDDHEART